MWTMLSDIFTTLCSLSCGDTLQSVCCWNVNRSIPRLTTGGCKLFISKTLPWAHLILLLRHHLAAVYYLMSIYCTSTKMRDKLGKERRGSKGWWRIANHIMEKQGHQSSIPALKDAASAWVREPVAKANLLAATFAHKSRRGH